MKLKYGKVVKYLDRGFGFIQPLESSGNSLRKEVFFHIKVMKKYESELVKFQQDPEQELYFWFTDVDGEKGTELLQAWSDVEDIPNEVVCSFLEQFATSLVKSKPEKMSSKLATPTKIYQPILHPTLLKLSTPVDLTELCSKYRKDPLGMRNDARIRHVCIKCCTDNSEFKKTEKEEYKLVSEFRPTRYSKSAEGFHRCCNCGNKWYINHCWSCHSARVDDRDPETPRCGECSWCKCAKCSACSYYGCSTNEYSKENRYVDNDPLDFL